MMTTVTIIWNSRYVVQPLCGHIPCYVFAPGVAMENGYSGNYLTVGNMSSEIILSIASYFIDSVLAV